MKKTETRIYEGNRAKGYTTINNGIRETTYSESVARRNGVIRNDVPTYAKCCGWSNQKSR